MDYERMERTMQFILEQQARTTGTQAEAETRMEQMERTMQFIVNQQAAAQVASDTGRDEAQARMGQMERAMQFIVDQQAAAQVTSDTERGQAQARMERMERAMQFVVNQQAANEAGFAQFKEVLATSVDNNQARFDQIGEMLAVLLADRDTRLVETDKLHEDIVLLSRTVSAHHEQIQSLTVLMGRLIERVDTVADRVDKLAEVVRLTCDNGHNGRA